MTPPDWREEEWRSHYSTHFRSSCLSSFYSSWLVLAVVSSLSSKSSALAWPFFSEDSWDEEEVLRRDAFPFPVAMEVDSHHHQKSHLRHLHGTPRAVEIHYIQGEINRWFACFIWLSKVSELTTERERVCERASGIRERDREESSYAFSITGIGWPKTAIGISSATRM